MNTAVITASPAAARFFAAVPSGLLARLLRAVQTPDAPATRRLDTGATSWVNKPLGRTISCQTGTLWLTFDGQPRDIVLEAGQSHRCVSSSALSIHAISAATVRVG